MAHPVTATDPIPTDLDPPPTYEYVMKLEQFKNHNGPPPTPPQPQPNMVPPYHHYPHHHQGPMYPGMEQSHLRMYPGPIPMQHHQYSMQNYHKPDQDPTHRKNLICLYAIGFLDMTTSAMLISSVSNFISDKADKAKDLDLFILEYSLVLSCLVIQFFMGAILIVGLRTTNDAYKIACFRVWVFGAYLLICKDIFLLIGIIFKFSTVANYSKGRLGIVVKIFNILFRVFWAMTMRKYADYLRARLAFPTGLVETGGGDQVVAKDMRHLSSAPGRVCPIETKA